MVPTASSRARFLTQLLSQEEPWPGPQAMISDLKNSFGWEVVGIRWPAYGTALLHAESGPADDSTISYPLPLPGRTDGVFWERGEVDRNWVKLLIQSLAFSPQVLRWLGPSDEQTRVAQRLTDAAAVAGRIAHDFDNVFQGVTGFASLALEVLPANSIARQHILEVDRAAQNGIRFSGQLHQLSRAGITKPLPSPLEMVLQKEVGRVQVAHPRLNWEVDCPGSLLPVAIEPGGLQIILGHLLDNAAEATPKEGTIRVTARMAELSLSDISTFLGSLSPGSHVEVNIHNEGPGLTTEAQRRVFVEPFYTTKIRHRGLGLAIVARMLFAHRSGVQLRSGNEVGTTVRLALPLATAIAMPAVISRSPGGTHS